MELNLALIQASPKLTLTSEPKLPTYKPVMAEYENWAHSGLHLR